MIEHGEQSRAAIAALEKMRVSAAERHRMLRFEERYRLYCDDYQDLIADEVRRVFVNQDRAARIAILGDATINPFKQVVDDTYAYPGARRRFVELGEVDASTGKPLERADAVYDDELLQEQLDLLMSEAHACLGGFNDGLLQCLPAREDGAGKPLGLPKMRLFYPGQVSVVEDEEDPSQAAEVRYLTIRPNGEELVVGWSATEHWLENAKGHRLPPRGREEDDDPFRNPYGRLPFVAIHDGLRPDCFWDEMSGEDLVAFTKQYGRDWAALNLLQQQQSHLQLHVDGMDESWPGFEDIGVGALLQTSGNAKVNVLNLQAQLEPSIAKLKAQLMLKMKSYGLDAERFFNPGQTPSSGIARRIEREDLIEKRRRIRPFIKQAERDFAELFRWAYNWGAREKKISEKAKFRVEILDEQVVQSAEEKASLEKQLLENAKTALAMGLKTEAEVVAEYRGITVEQAERFIAARKPAQQKPELFGYDLENGVVTLGEAHAAKGLGEHPRPDLRDLTVPEFKALVESKSQPDDEPQPPAGFRPAPAGHEAEPPEEE